MENNSKNCHVKPCVKSLLVLAIVIANILLTNNQVKAASVKQPVLKESAKEVDNISLLFDETLEYYHPFEQLSKWRNFFTTNSFYSYLNNNEKEYILNIEIPGFEKEQVTVELQGDYIIIKAQKLQDKTKNDDTPTLNQKSRNLFYQKLFLPKDVNKNLISSSLKNGILTIILPKSPIKAEEIKVIPID